MPSNNQATDNQKGYNYNYSYSLNSVTTNNNISSNNSSNTMTNTPTAAGIVYSNYKKTSATSSIPKKQTTLQIKPNNALFSTWNSRNQQQQWQRHNGNSGNNHSNGNSRMEVADQQRQLSQQSSSLLEQHSAPSHLRQSQNSFWVGSSRTNGGDHDIPNLNNHFTDDYNHSSTISSNTNNSNNNNNSHSNTINGFNNIQQHQSSHPQQQSTQYISIQQLSPRRNRFQQQQNMKSNISSGSGLGSRLGSGVTPTSTPTPKQREFMMKAQSHQNFYNQSSKSSATTDKELQTHPFYQVDFKKIHSSTTEIAGQPSTIKSRQSTMLDAYIEWVHTTFKQFERSPSVDGLRRINQQNKQRIVALHGQLAQSVQSLSVIEQAKQNKSQNISAAYNIAAKKQKQKNLNNKPTQLPPFALHSQQTLKLHNLYQQKQQLLAQYNKQQQLSNQLSQQLFQQEEIANGQNLDASRIRQKNHLEQMGQSVQQLTEEIDQLKGKNSELMKKIGNVPFFKEWDIMFEESIGAAKLSVKLKQQIQNREKVIRSILGQEEDQDMNNGQNAKDNINGNRKDWRVSTVNSQNKSTKGGNTQPNFNKKGSRTYTTTTNSHLQQDPVTAEQQDNSIFAPIKRAISRAHSRESAAGPKKSQSPSEKKQLATANNSNGSSSLTTNFIRRQLDSFQKAVTGSGIADSANQPQQGSSTQSNFGSRLQPQSQQLQPHKQTEGQMPVRQLSHHYSGRMSEAGRSGSSINGPLVLSSKKSTVSSAGYAAKNNSIEKMNNSNPNNSNNSYRKQSQSHDNNNRRNQPYLQPPSQQQLNSGKFFPNHNQTNPVINSNHNSDNHLTYQSMMMINPSATGWKGYNNHANINNTNMIDLSTTTNSAIMNNNFQHGAQQQQRAFPGNTANTVNSTTTAGLYQQYIGANRK